MGGAVLQESHRAVMFLYTGSRQEEFEAFYADSIQKIS